MCLFKNILKARWNTHLNIATNSNVRNKINAWGSKPAPNDYLKYCLEFCNEVCFRLSLLYTKLSAFKLLGYILLLFLVHWSQSCFSGDHLLYTLGGMEWLVLSSSLLVSFPRGRFSILSREACIWRTKRGDPAISTREQLVSCSVCSDPLNLVRKVLGQIYNGCM